MSKTRRDFLSYTLTGGTLAASGAALIGIALQPVKADPREDIVAAADLLALGAEFEAAWQTETAAYEAYQVAKRAGLTEPGTDDGTGEWNAAVDVTSAIVRRIEEHPARTLAGACVKARATFWCYAGDLAEMLDDVSEEATANRLAFAIVADLLGMPAPAA